MSTVRHGKSKGRTRNSSFDNWDEKPFPNSRPPKGWKPTSVKQPFRSYNPLEAGLPDKLQDRYVYWEDEEGLHKFDERSEWELDIEDVESSDGSKLSPILVNFPMYDYSIKYPDYKRWQQFCIKHNQMVPYRIFLEFDEGINN
ncbi:MAG: hypothetical protein JEY79_01140 [Pseudodesulfovibrio sp.]|nr:hypothetical protein [Pseudodesulfovibrio sp.]